MSLSMFLLFIVLALFVTFNDAAAVPVGAASTSGAVGQGQTATSTTGLIGATDTTTTSGANGITGTTTTFATTAMTSTTTLAALLAAGLTTTSGPPTTTILTTTVSAGPALHSKSCATLPNGALYQEPNCTVYYHCQYILLVAFQCPPGFDYNPKTEKCDMRVKLPGC